MAPTYKDLAKTWLSNWLAGVRGAEQCACVHARRNRGRSACGCGREREPCPDRYMLDVTHYKTGTIQEFASFANRQTRGTRASARTLFAGSASLSLIMKILKSLEGWRGSTKNRFRCSLIFGGMQLDRRERHFNFLVPRSPDRHFARD